MTHLDIIKEAYDKCEVAYVIKTKPQYPNYCFLIRIGEHRRAEWEAMSDDEALRQANEFMEFENGRIVSY